MDANKTRLIGSIPMLPITERSTMYTVQYFSDMDRSFRTLLTTDDESAARKLYNETKCERLQDWIVLKIGSTQLAAK